MAMVSFPKKSPIKTANPSLEERKKLLRCDLKRLREKISAGQRTQAARSLLLSLKALNFPLVLSFVSFGSEIDTSLLNDHLAQQGQLVLPKIEGDTLSCYRVSNTKQHLAPNSLGILEPIESLCPKIPLTKISLILVPGLAFDRHHHRIGYGRGFYDRLLAALPDCPSYGIGFSEQLVDPLPISLQDVSVKELHLF